ncbi:hypothetical protein Acr_16g0000860 [Actinidia rufa]|uniref:Uncharacterized protein n=1 Tax=Actinidia rufa TaxID=165716 RepID=A0A7J0FXN7_9ERIC|nr:hypothetical protein Acr_16g0000860 [Actinidia rufa]
MEEEEEEDRDGEKRIEKDGEKEAEQEKEDGKEADQEGEKNEDTEDQEKKKDDSSATESVFPLIFMVAKLVTKFEFPDAGIPNLPTISRELLLVDDNWDGDVKCNKTHLKDSIGKAIDLPSMMFMSLCSAYESSDVRGSMLFLGFLMALFKRHEIVIPMDLIRIASEKPIDRYSLTRSEGQRNKRASSASKEPSVGIS